MEKALFDDIVGNPAKWLLDVENAEKYKRALSVLIEENHDNPYDQMFKIIECEVKQRVSEKLFKLTEYATEHLDECQRVCSECDVAVENHGRYCENRKSDFVKQLCNDKDSYKATCSGIKNGAADLSH